MVRDAGQSPNRFAIHARRKQWQKTDRADSLDSLLTTSSDRLGQQRCKFLVEELDRVANGFGLRPDHISGRKQPRDYLLWNRE
jgi:hypothetical protein